MVDGKWFLGAAVAGLLIGEGVVAEAQRAADMPLDSAPQVGRRSQAGVDNLSVATDRAGSSTANFGMLSVDRPTARSAAAAQRTELVAKLHGANVAAIDLGRLAEQRGQLEDTRAFGARLARDHKASDDALMAFASRRGINAGALYAASEERKRDRAELERLGHLPSAVLDRQLATAVEQHEIATVEMVQAARETPADVAGDVELRVMLGQFLPTLEAQLLTVQGVLTR